MSRQLKKLATNFIVYLVPGGGLEPPRPCGLRILSPILGLAHSLALRRTEAHNSVIYNDMCRI